MSINELSNEEVLFLYFSNRKWLDTYDDIAEHKSIVSGIDILDYGHISVTRFVLDEEIDGMKKTSHYRLANVIEEKLGPLVDLIEDADPTLFNEVKECFNKIEI